MIEPAAMPSVSLVPGTGATMPATPGNPADPAAFADVLASEEAGLQAGATTFAGAEAAPALAGTVAASRQLPAALLANGNILPASLALLESGPAVIASSDQRPATTPGLPVPGLPLLRTIRPAQAEQADGEASEADPAPTAQGADGPDQSSAAMLLTVTTLIGPFALAQPGATGTPAAPEHRSDAARPGAAAAIPPPALMLPQAIAAQVLGQPLPRAGQTIAAAGTPDALMPANSATEGKLSLPASPAVPQTEFTLASAAAPAAAGALHLRPVVERPVKPEAAAPDAAGGLALPGGTPDLAAATPAPATTPGLRAPGHDFGAVVDRLMAARDAVASGGPAQPVALAIRHAEFGEVSVRFEQRGDGLSVALASPDPEFARAVQAAAPSGSGGDAGANGSFTSGGFAGSASGSQSHNASGQAGQNGPSQNGQRTRAGEPDRAGRPAPGQAPDAKADASPRGIFA